MNALRSDPYPGVLALSITVSARDEETATAVLWELGTIGIELRDTSDIDEVQLLAYFPQDLHSELEYQVASRLRGRLREAPLRQPVFQVDWDAQWRDSFRSLTVGSLCIVPPWKQSQAPPDRRIVIESGRAFGTGSHETTQLCLELIELAARREPLGTVLDFGTGTGILAIAAARLGARSVIGLDIDADSLESARVHATLNGVSVLLVRANGIRTFRPASFDVVVANLTAPLLLEKSVELRASARRALVLSGFLSEDLGALRTAYASRRSTSRLRGEWAALLQEQA